MKIDDRIWEENTANAGFIENLRNLAQAAPLNQKNTRDHIACSFREREGKSPNSRPLPLLGCLDETRNYAAIRPIWAHRIHR